jgi:hypothetical protein
VGTPWPATAWLTSLMPYGLSVSMHFVARSRNRSSFGFFVVVPV